MSELPRTLRTSFGGTEDCGETEDLEAERGGFCAAKKRRSDELALSPQLAVLLAVRVNLSAGKIADAFPDSIK